MKVKGLKWIDTELELSKIRNEWAKIDIATQKYQWRPEFLWSRTEVEEVVELLEKAYELELREFEIFRLMGDYDKMAIVSDGFGQLESEIWRLKQLVA